MYALVNDIESYPAFLSWCEKAELLEVGEKALTAVLHFNLLHFRYALTTRNVMQPGYAIDMSLLSGPFRRFRGRWRFEPLDEGSCRIRFDLDFEFKNRLLRASLNKALHGLFSSLVEAFRRRADELYGGIEAPLRTDGAG